MTFSSTFRMSTYIQVDEVIVLLATPFMAYLLVELGRELERFEELEFLIREPSVLVGGRALEES